MSCLLVLVAFFNCRLIV